jgi:DNA-binding response OmpR family regulator
MSTDSTHGLPHGEIMVVEDTPSSLKFLSDILTRAGYRVRPASDGELALRSVRAKLPDLILLDFKLPGMNGVEVCRRLKAGPGTRDLPVIFISALGATELKVKALEAGGVDYVTKPFEPSEILARIDTHLNLHRLQQRLAVQSEELIAEIEERKQTEEELAKHREHLEELVEERTAALRQSEER